MALADLIYVDATGFKYPDYPTILNEVTNEFKSIYGIDAYVNPDSQDGQNLAVRATAIYDTLQFLAGGLTQFSPTFAQGAWLSSTVKLNGITRQSSTYSTVDLVLVGTTGTILTDCKAEDINGKKWLIPITTIPLSGTITVTATAELAGAITASSGTVTKIATPTIGWQSVNNVSSAVSGRDTENDATLRQRQKTSTAMPSLSVLDGLTGNISNLSGVTRNKSYENDSNVTDSDGIPAHSIAEIVEGGVSADIASAIALRKTPGTGTYGTTAVLTYDRYGIPNSINFFRPTTATIQVEVTISALAGYNSSYGDLIKTAVINSINALTIGDDVILTKLYVPANLPATDAGSTFNISLIRIGKNSGALGTSNIVLAFNEVALSILADITVIVV